MSNYIYTTSTGERYYALDDFFGHHQYWYKKVPDDASELTELDTWKYYTGSREWVLTEKQFAKLYPNW
jgi:hypothetical protein